MGLSVSSEDPSAAGSSPGGLTWGSSASWQQMGELLGRRGTADPDQPYLLCVYLFIYF